MFALPNLDLLTRKPLPSLPAFSSLKSVEQLIELYQSDFVPFCAESRALVDAHLCAKLARGKFDIFAIDRDEDVFLRSLIRQHDILVLEQIFNVYQTFKGQNLFLPDFKIKILEIGAGCSFTLDPENLSAPWLSRWLAARFPELEIEISDIAGRWDLLLEKNLFGIKDALLLDYSALNSGRFFEYKFVFGRHLNQVSTELHTQNFPFESHMTSELDDVTRLLAGLYSFLPIGGQAVIDYDRGPLLNLKVSEMRPAIAERNIVVLYDAEANLVIHPRILDQLPRLADFSFSQGK